MRTDGGRIIILLCFFAALALAAFAGAETGADLPEPSAFRHRVDLNNADADELALLPGAGPEGAKAIIEHRARFPFRSAEDLVNVRYRSGRNVFKEEAVRQLRDYVTIRNPAGGEQ